SVSASALRIDHVVRFAFVRISDVTSSTKKCRRGKKLIEAGCLIRVLGNRVLLLDGFDSLRRLSPVIFDEFVQCGISSILRNEYFALIETMRDNNAIDIFYDIAYSRRSLMFGLFDGYDATYQP